MVKLSTDHMLCDASEPFVPLHPRQKTTLIPATMTTATNSDMERTSAATKVASIPELLEHILLYLPLRTLLLVQTVSKSFHLFIQGSIKIKRALFLEPTGDKTVSWHGPTSSGRLQPEGCEIGRWQYSNGAASQAIKPMLNPFLLS